MSRLETTFMRLTQHNITLNPDKCKMGVTSIEYIGHVIDELGLKFTPEKLSSVLNFKTPHSQKEMKSFLGLATYFRDHVAHFSSLAAPLHGALRNYSPKKPFAWTSDLMTSFNNLKQAVYACDTLYFPAEEGQFIVETDASALGIGAALFQEVQTVDGLVKRPVAFLSKALSDTQRRWATIEQEAFAIYHAITTWRHFLRDVKFVLRTDHKNLTYISTNEDSKVVRWKVDLQAYNFDLEWLPGDENEVADILSRQFPTETLNAFYTGPITYGSIQREGDAHATIAEFHSSTVGHFGSDTTLKRLRSRGVSWPGMEEDVRFFVQACPTCQKLSDQRPQVTSPYFTNFSYAPMTRLNVDTIGPFTPDSAGNAYVIVIIDTFTRFVELYKTPDATALSAAQALIQHCGRYGVPQQLLTDNGKQFYNGLIEALTASFGMEHLFTVPYSHEENGLVERANKEVSRHLRAIVLDQRIHGSWSDVLPLVQRIMNAKVHESTGVAPAALLFGNMVDLDRLLLHSPSSHNALSTMPTSTHEYVTQLEHAQRILSELAVENQSKKESKQRDAKRARIATEFEPGSYVLVSHPEGRRPSKLSAKLLGPYRVIGRVPSSDELTPAEYTLLDLVDNKEKQIGVHRLRPYIYDALHNDPALTATTDKEAFIVEEIQDHYPKCSTSTFVKLPKNKMKFLVKYHNYDEPEWNSWHNLRNNGYLHVYLRGKGMSTLIPKQFK